MSALVSIIIPCYNAEKWIAEAITSCLQQTYENIEVIVIDDGSTDNSFDIIKGFGEQVIFHTQPHHGGNCARNLGLKLAQGEYIQFLDADDYLLPEKIARQVDFLEQTGADIVYGDWRHQYHRDDGKVVLEPVQVSGQQTDILVSLLGNWWVALASLLYRHSAIQRTCGWDEKLEAAQDRDFFIFAVLHGGKVVYQPGCYAVYRRYGNTSVSTISIPRWINSHCQVLRKVEYKLSQTCLVSVNLLPVDYRRALATCYFDLARKALEFDYSVYQQLLVIALDRFPEFTGNSTNPIYQAIRSLIGFRRLEQMICFGLRLRLFLNLLFLRVRSINYLQENIRFIRKTIIIILYLKSSRDKLWCGGGDLAKK